MRNAKLAASLLAVSMLATTVMAGCSGDEESSKTSTSTPTSDPGNTSTGESSSTQTVADVNKKWEKDPGLKYDAGVELRMAVGYKGADTGITFTTATAGTGLKLSNGKTYTVDQLKPTWEALETKLGVKFKNVYQGNDVGAEFKFWNGGDGAQLKDCDMVAGNATEINPAGVQGRLVNLAEYLDIMPNFKAYLDANPIVRLSITGATDGVNAGAIYFCPYFDGVDDIERMTLMRVDWVEKLLNGSGKFTADASGNIASTLSYEAYMPTSGKHQVTVVKADATGTEVITKDYDAAGGNVVNLMQPGMSGVDAVNVLRDYIDKAYNGYYGEKRADLFIGQNAAWDADELVALLRCVVSNAKTLNGTDGVQGLFSRIDNDNSRRIDMFRFAGTLFGVRGLESRQGYMYVGNDNKIHDARTDEATWKAMEKMNQMAAEGLISATFMNSTAPNNKQTTQDMMENNAGFMHYDYNQTQTAFNTMLKDGGKYMAVITPVAQWDDGTGKKLMRFTESWRSVKTQGWAISAAGVKDNDNKLYALLALIDFAFSKEGQILMSYGPDDFIQTNADGTYKTFNFNGEQWPMIKDSTYEELWKLVPSGSYTDYARKFLGSTLSLLKSQAFEIQCTHAVGKEGAQQISNAIGFGVIEHPRLALNGGDKNNAWYTSVPTTLPLETGETAIINGPEASALSSDFSTSKDKKNVLVDIIANSVTDADKAKFGDAKTAVKTITDTYHGNECVEVWNDAWDRLQDFYKKL